MLNSSGARKDILESETGINETINKDDILRPVIASIQVKVSSTLKTSDMSDL